MPAAVHERAVVDDLVRDPAILTAAVLGHEYGMDPVQIIRESDTFAHLIRLAAYRRRQDELKAAERKGGK